MGTSRSFVPNLALSAFFLHGNLHCSSQFSYFPLIPRPPRPPNNPRQKNKTKTKIPVYLLFSSSVWFDPFVNSMGSWFVHNQHYWCQKGSFRMYHIFYLWEKRVSYDSANNKIMIFDLTDLCFGICCVFFDVPRRSPNLALRILQILMSMCLFLWERGSMLAGTWRERGGGLGMRMRGRRRKS